MFACSFVLSLLLLVTTLSLLSKQRVLSELSPLRSLSFFPFTMYYGTSANDFWTTMSQTSDGGFILAGTTQVNGNILVVKTNSLGQTQWA